MRCGLEYFVNKYKSCARIGTVIRRGEKTAEATNIESVFRWKIHVPRIESQEIREMFCVLLVFMISIVTFIDNNFKKDLYRQTDKM